ncbi:peptidoglycan-binding domain-containing protein [Agromyces allii]|uniref:Peptidoglycan binding-like domain-containing protein n=1 Tax=Agromyces allii TaxID=393607 RepID=A0ABN2RFE9_9MICO|nr:peptidoglycan-binding domain-containing protein [Agromyces allii]
MQDRTDDKAGSQSKRQPKAIVVLVGLLAVASIGALIGWAMVVVFAPPNKAVLETPFTDVQVVQGEVGTAISLNTVAQWTQQPVGTNQAAGIVTGIRVDAGDEVAAGQTLYEVGLRPIVIAAGITPAFRDIAVGSRGSDVLQVQQFLATIGMYDGAQDGEFGNGTAAAVEDWQASLGVDEDGVVRAADLVFVPTLPARIRLDGEVVYRGATLVGGEAVVSALSSEPAFKIPVTAQQGAKIPPGTAVEIAAQGRVWHAVAGGQEPSSDGGDQVQVLLTSPNNASICLADCSLVPIEGESLLASRIITQPTVTGLIVPSAALKSSADNEVSVIGVTGVEHTVTVIASANGMSVVEGIAEGLRVRIPVEPNGTE